MVGKLFIAANRCGARRCRQSRRGNFIIDAPAHVFGTGLTALTPPGVLIRPGIKSAEHVTPAELIKAVREPRSFFGQKPRVFEISSPVFNIDFLVRDV